MRELMAGPGDVRGLKGPKLARGRAGDGGTPVALRVEVSISWPPNIAPKASPTRCARPWRRSMAERSKARAS